MVFNDIILLLKFNVFRVKDLYLHIFVQILRHNLYFKYAQILFQTVTNKLHIVKLTSFLLILYISNKIIFPSQYEIRYLSNYYLVIFFSFFISTPHSAITCPPICNYYLVYLHFFPQSISLRLQKNHSHSRNIYNSISSCDIIKNYYGQETSCR